MADQRAAVVDEFGDLDRRVALFKPDIERHKELRREIASWLDPEPAEQTAVFDGRRYQVQVSARANERRIADMPLLYRLLGKLRFLNLCNVPLKHVDKYVPEDQIAAVVTEERTGERRVKVIPKFPPAAVSGLRKAA